MTKLDREIHGNIQGIRQSVLASMEELYDMPAEQGQFVSEEMAHALCIYTEALNREIAVYIARDGGIKDVSIGDAGTAALSDMRLVRSEERLSGVRCVHTHPGGNPNLSKVDLGTLQSARMDAMASIGVLDGRATGMQAAFLAVQEGEAVEGEQIITLGPATIRDINRSQWEDIVRAGDRALIQAAKTQAAEDGPERAVLLGIDTGKGDFDGLDELEELAKTAGAFVVGQESQKRGAADHASYVGGGKLQELGQLCTSLRADLVIADDELTAVQLRNIEEAVHCRVIDRTALILDIFAARAGSREGKLQVELAQQKYRLPRLMGMGQVMSRLGAGIGTRGPGEKKLETDRRRIRRRIYELECDIDELSKQRDLRRAQRRKNAVPVVALVGYTNAGKSTLLNALSGSDVLAEDMLFATLDPVTRSLTLPEGTQILLSDTVGFIRKLPHELVQAFRSTLEEVRYADMILHVVDASNPKAIEQMDVVREVLGELQVTDTPILNVFNKVDRLPEEASTHIRGEGLYVSAKAGQGLGRLLNVVEEALTRQDRDAEILIPYDRGDLEAMVRRNGTVLAESFEEEGWRLRVRAPQALWGALEKALTAGEGP